MELNFPDLRDINPGIRLGILLTPFLIFWVLIYLVLYAPKIKKLKGYSVEIKGLEQDFSHSLEMIVNYKPPSPQYQQEWEISKALLWADSSPDEKLSQLVERLARLAKVCNISEISFITKEKSGFLGGRGLQRMSRFRRMRALRQTQQKQASYPGSSILSKHGYELNYIPIESAFNSGYRELARFLAAIKKEVPTVEIEVLEIKREVPLISVSLVLKAYYVQKEDHAPE